MLNLLEAMRARMVPPLENLRQNALHTDGEGFAKALYGFLCECEIAQKCEEKSAQMKAGGHFKEGEDYLRTWELLCQALETMARLLKGVHKSLAFYTQVMQLLFLNLDLGNIPQTADQVLVARPTACALTGQKVVFLLGANEGVFPAVMATTVCLPPTSGAR